MRRFPLLIGALALAPGCWSTHAAAEVARGTLRAVSLQVVEVFNARDGAALRDMLTPDQRRDLEPDELASRLAECHQRFGALERVSLPTMGTRTYGLFAAYFATAVRDLFLEIDAVGNLKVLTIVGPDGSCSLAGPQSADPAI